MGATIPTAWLIIVPFVNIYWLWKYSEGVEKVTNGALTGVLAFVLQFLLGTIGAAILQNEFNKPVASAAPSVPGGPIAALPVNNSPMPDDSFGGPTETTTITPTFAAPITPTTFTPASPAPQGSVSVAPTMSDVTTPTTPNNAQPTQQS